MDRHDDPADRIIPDEFFKIHGTDDPAEALQLAQSQRSTTPRSDRKRCANPECRSVRIRLKVGPEQPTHQRPESWRCTVCGTHFNNPIDPQNDE